MSLPKLHIFYKYHLVSFHTYHNRLFTIKKKKEEKIRSGCKYYMYITKNYLIELSCENLIYKAKTFTDFRIIDNTVYTFRIYIYISIWSKGDNCQGTVQVQVTRVHPHINCKNSHKNEIMTLEWCN